ncbi:MAG: Putative ABC transporter, solute binding protein [Methanothrix harundinacea]|uniref:Putative ABC transporter, solute binding protein n=1 Tax=Methanothrix harundinacea TaxID=301375 RepID=A0A101IIE1_9EURY|nr:MAG: Putative ABC transporter, solute binding protein [Methanothrix harundinacea]
MNQLAFGFVVLTFILQAVMPAIAADYTLGIFGNANMDDTIDENDVAYVEGIIAGTNEETLLADANYDGVIDEDDITLITQVMRSLDMDKEFIVAISSSATSKEDFFPEFQTALNVGTGWEPDVEKVIEADPDIVFLYATQFVASCDEVQNQLENAGLTVVRFDCFRPETYLDEVSKLGFILDKEDDADDFAEFYNKCLNDIKDKVEDIPEDEKPRVYFEGFGDPYNVGGVGTVTHQIVVEAGGYDIFGDVTGYKVVDKEEVMVRDPEIIVVQGYYVIIKELTGNKHFLAIGYLAKWFYPELFEDLNPQAIHQEYLTRFQGLDCDLDEHGVFAYPA